MNKPVDYVLKFHKDFYPVIKSGYKYSTIRAGSKPLRVDDLCFAYFHEIGEVLILRIKEHYSKRLIDLTDKEAESEGYMHPCLLRHELKNIYPELKTNDYVYYYRFELVNNYGRDLLKCLNEFEKKITKELED
ncbi:MAG: ASCH domain-containing protein [Methanobrevibacter sp.]|nr:ASCH domain-containing protein [Methanosphaera sp.]MBR0371100.1 ASCH domain-containing protein [Methanobrevibacter sp.]